MTQTSPIQAPVRYTGEVVYLYAYDVAYEITGEVPTLLGQPGRQFAAAATRRMPKDPFFYQPQMFPLPDLPPAVPRAFGPARGTVKLFPVGAFSIAVHVPFEVASLSHDAEGNPAPFQTLQVLVDGNREIADVTRENNGAAVPRSHRGCLIGRQILSWA